MVQLQEILDLTNRVVFVRKHVSVVNKNKRKVQKWPVSHHLMSSSSINARMEQMREVSTSGECDVNAVITLELQ